MMTLEGKDQLKVGTVCKSIPMEICCENYQTLLPAVMNTYPKYFLHLSFEFYGHYNVYRMILFSNIQVLLNTVNDQMPNGY